MDVEVKTKFDEERPCELNTKYDRRCVVLLPKSGRALVAMGLADVSWRRRLQQRRLFWVRRQMRCPPTGLTISMMWEFWSVTPGPVAVPANYFHLETATNKNKRIVHPKVAHRGIFYLLFQMFCAWGPLSIALLIPMYIDKDIKFVRFWVGKIIGMLHPCLPSWISVFKN